MSHKRLCHILKILKSNLILKKTFLQRNDQFQRLAWPIYRPKIFRFADFKLKGHLNVFDLLIEIYFPFY